MAIIDHQQPQQNRQQEQPQTQPQTSTEPPATHGPRPVFQRGGIFAAPISRTIGSDFYRKLRDRLIQTYKENANKEVQIAVIDLDNVNVPELRFSSLVIAVTYPDRPKCGVAYHTLILEPTGERLPPLIETIQNQQIEITRVAGDALDDVLLTRARERVQRAFPTARSYHMVDSTVVGSLFNVEDEGAVNTLALNAGLACTTELELRDPNFRDLSIDRDFQGAGQISINMAFQKQQILDAVGSPMRSDILLNFSTQRQQGRQDRRIVNNGDNEQKLSELSGFINVLWSPENPHMTYNPYMPAQVPTSRKYIAELVLTNLASNFSYTPGSILMALISALALRENSNWIQALRPVRTHGDDVDLHDIGVLNIEANLTNDPSGYGARIDTKSSSFTPEELGQYVGALIQPGLAISLDIPENGPQSWYLSAFLASSQGISNAYGAIIETANDLFGGRFVNHFRSGSPIFVNPHNRIHLGYWTDNNGQRRDIRDFDHVAVGNLTADSNPQVMRDWSDTFLRTQYPLEMRLHHRKRLIMSLSNESAVFTGFAQRPMFSGEFLDAIAACIREVGLDVRVNTPMSGADFNNQRGVASFASSALMAPGQIFHHASAFGAAGNYGNFHHANTRWS